MQISTNFNSSEFACKHCGVVRYDMRLVDALQSLRTLCGVPILISSAYRCPTHPLSISNPHSRHISGEAADIIVRGYTVLEMYGAAQSVYSFLDGGIGLYDSGFIHVDVRDGQARWARINGQYVDINQFRN